MQGLSSKAVDFAKQETKTRNQELSKDKKKIIIARYLQFVSQRFDRVVSFG